MFNHASTFPITEIQGQYSKEFCGKTLSEEVLAFADQSSRCCIKIVKEMEDIASLMADYTGMMKRNICLLFSSNTVLV